MLRSKCRATARAHDGAAAVPDGVELVDAGRGEALGDLSGERAEATRELALQQSPALDVEN